MTTGADLLCDTLLGNGIDTCFANPGTSEMHFVAALDRKPAMRCILGLAEGVVTGMADGYARMAEKPAATLLHLGPGLANGLANLHNAKRAGTPIVNVVGDHASYHLALDAPLTSDIAGLARPMSHWVGRADGADDVSRAAAQAVSAAWTPPGGIATLILPADASWGKTAATVEQAVRQPPGQADEAAIRAAAELLQASRAGRVAGGTLILLAGSALRATTTLLASRIARFTGARLLAQASARIERGAGRVPIDRVPYAVDKALAALADIRQVILVGAQPPVAFFAYPGKPGELLPPGCRVTQLSGPGDDPAQALGALADRLGLPPDVQPDLGVRDDVALPTGPLTSAAIARAITALSPDHAVICNESISSGHEFFPASFGARPHDFLQLTGGAIGIGLPMATGAAVACPGRKVILMQADGSGMYTLQALWTQARERLDVVTIVFSNRRYAILHHELRQVGAGEPGRNARHMLDLDDPALDWVSLARGMGVEAVRVQSAEDFGQALKSGIARSGPFLIEAVL